MAYKPRVRGESGIYHIVTKGINSKNIFNEISDKEYFIKILERAKRKYNFNLYGYALMSNHFHLLLEEGEYDSISTILQSIKVSYINYYNKKYGRTGTIYNGRFHSEPVENNEYLIAVLRYITQNPIKIGETLEWTNYRELILFTKNQLTDRSKVLKLIFGYKQRYNKKRIEKFLLTKYEKDCLEISNSRPVSDKAAKKIIMAEIAKMASCKEFVKNINKYRGIINRIKKERVSLLQISRILGVNKNRIYKI
ncbi:MAG: transposase [Clostridiales Family XIII bacterium]|jgi:REP element-mobilizing transposase RayT|nr:transposase [Clostridiales Family XIII bacterium]